MARRARHGAAAPCRRALLYTRRKLVERCVNRLKQWRGLATRYEKRAANYRALIVVAAIMPWLAG